MRVMLNTKINYYPSTITGDQFKLFVRFLWH